MSQKSETCCPRCGGASRSVAALAAAETRHRRAAGRFSGSGVGVGTFGIGVGFGGGSYAEDRTTQSERARLFAPPKWRSLPFAVWSVLGLVLALLALPELLDVALGAVVGPAPTLPPPPPAARAILGVMGAVAAVVTLSRWTGRIEAHQARENDLNERLPARRARYNELRYCEGCHALFDGQGRVEAADRGGYARMMEAC